MKEQQQNIVNQFYDVRQPGMAGINTLVDQHDIKDQEAVDLNNMIFDQGVIGVRAGSKLFAAKPTGETGNPLELMIAKTSDGVNFIIAIYTSGTATNNFYVWDATTSAWIKINGSYLPTFTAVSYFGNQSWNYGYAYDAQYFCNGYDDMCKWRMAKDYLSKGTAAGDITITLSDASRFPVYQAAVSSLSGNVAVLAASPQQNAIHTNSWELGQMVYYVGSGITGLTSGTIYYAIPTAYSLPTNGVSSNSIGFASTLANAVAGTAISLGGSPSSCTIYKAEPLTIVDGTSTYSTVYYAKSTNVLSLTAQIGSAISNGAVVVPTITDRPGCPKGNIVTSWNSRLVVANAPAVQMSVWNSGSTTFQTYPASPTAIVSPTTGVPGSGNTMWLSRISAPEDYITNQADIASGGNQIFSDGSGSITDIKDFGQFLVVSKANIQYRFSFIQNDTISAQFPQITPIVSGVGMGPISYKASVKALNSIYYPTASTGFVMLSPNNTGFTSASGLEVISYNINNLIQSGYNFSNSKGEFFYNKLLFTATNPKTANTVFVYDTIRKSWTKFDNWSPVDMGVVNSNTFYFLSSIDGNVYQGFTGYTDNNQAYLPSFKTKMHNFGKPSLVKTMDAIYVEGYMTQATVIYADVAFNEKGVLSTQTYQMSYGQTGFSFTPVTIDALGMIPFYGGIEDSLAPSQLQAFGYFRTYLSVPNRYGVYAVQINFRSKAANSVWFITGYGMNPQFEPQVPPTMRLDPSSSTPVIQ